MRPLFRRKGSKVGSGSEQKQGKSSGGSSDQSLRDVSGAGSEQDQEKGSFGSRSNPSLNFFPSSPASNQSKDFGHVEQSAKSCV